MPVIDTNVLIYDTVEDSKYHETAKDILDSEDPWSIPSIVIYEYVWFFKRQNYEPEEVKTLLKNYLTDPRKKIITDDGDHSTNSLNILEDENLSLKHYNDMVILSSARGSEQPIVTFDGKLRGIADRYEVELIPETI